MDFYYTFIIQGEYMEFLLRAHHMFCIQGFRGKGYSEEFISNMKTIIDYLRQNKNLKIKVVNNSDHICLGYPNNIGQEKMRKFKIGKTYRDRGFCKNESEIANLGNMVLETLGIGVGSYHTYSELLDKIRIKLTKEKFENICGDCQWYSLGYCSESLFSKK